MCCHMKIGEIESRDATSCLRLFGDETKRGQSTDVDTRLILRGENESQVYICPKTGGGGGSLMVLMDFCQCWPFSRCYVSRRGGYVIPF